jgi:hypothetical protein
LAGMLESLHQSTTLGLELMHLLLLETNTSDSRRSWNITSGIWHTIDPMVTMFVANSTPSIRKDLTRLHTAACQLQTDLN